MRCGFRRERGSVHPVGFLNGAVGGVNRQPSTRRSPDPTSTLLRSSSFRIPARCIPGPPSQPRRETGLYGAAMNRASPTWGRSGKSLVLLIRDLRQDGCLQHRPAALADLSIRLSERRSLPHGLATTGRSSSRRRAAGAVHLGSDRVQGQYRSACANSALAATAASAAKRLRMRR